MPQSFLENCSSKDKKEYAYIQNGRVVDGGPMDNRLNGVRGPIDHLQVLDISTSKDNILIDRV